MVEVFSSGDVPFDGAQHGGNDADAFENQSLWQRDNKEAHKLMEEENTSGGGSADPRWRSNSNNDLGNE